MRLAKRLRSHIWSLPVELLIIIAGLLAPRDLRMLTQVSQRLADVAGYLLAIQQGLQITEDGSLVVSPAVFSAILVWRRSAGYRPLNRLHCWFSMNSAEGIRQLNILRAFFFSSPSVMHISLGLWSIEDPVLFADLLDSIRLTRCRKLTFHGSSPKFDNESPILRNMPTSDHPELQTLHADTRMMFTRTFLHYTVNAIVTSPIRDLSLSKTTFSSQQWGHFLPKLNIPHLESLALEAKVPIATLSKFLCRHPHILRLRISGGGDEQRFRLCKTTFQLPRLQSLIGPCAYIGALSQSFTLQHTQLTEIEIHSMSFSIHRLIALLASAAQCQTLCCLILELPGIPLNTSFFADRSQLDFSRVKILAIYCLTRMTAQRVVSTYFIVPPCILVTLVVRNKFPVGSPYSPQSNI
jgi:hypothetical protein